MYTRRSIAPITGPLPSSGLPGGRFEDAWTIRQIRTSQELLDEGTDLRHCVSSYRNAIMSKRSTIFSLKQDGLRCITLEVRLSECAIVQARGLQNRAPSALERKLIARWAADVGLTLRSI